MKRNPTPENRGVRTKVAQADSQSQVRIDVKPEPFGLTTLSDMDSVSITAEAIRQAGCRDVLIISTPDYVRFIVTVKLPQPR
jgi:hypothetical protein